jgi:hypothetical protein
MPLTSFAEARPARGQYILDMSIRTVLYVAAEHALAVKCAGNASRYSRRRGCE